MSPKLFEIVPFEKNAVFEELPYPDLPHYLIGSNGLFQRRNTALGIVTVAVKEYPEHLGKIPNNTGLLQYRAPQIPKRIIEQAWGFFRKTFEDRNSEAEVLILYNDQRRRYRLFVPHQVVTHSSVHSIYDPADIPAGYQVFGSIHSHCDFGAFHSGVDTDDASTFNGLHITMGKVNEDQPEFDVMVMMNGVRWNFKIDKVVTSTENLVPGRYPRIWETFFGTRKEISERTFKTLGKDELKEWENHFPKSSVTVGRWVNGKWTQVALDALDDDDDWWTGYRSNKFSPNIPNKQQSNWGNSQYAATQYSWEIRKYVKATWLDSHGKLRDEFFGDAVREVLEHLFEICIQRGIWLTTKMEAMSEDEIEVFKDSINLSRKPNNALLPGPFSVLGDSD